MVRELIRAPLLKKSSDLFNIASSLLDIGLLQEDDFRTRYNKFSYRLFVDMDGVLTDWMGQYTKFGGKPFESHDDIDWEVAESIEFWSEMGWLEGGKDLWKSLTHLDPIILSSPGASRFAREGKQMWIKKNLGERVNSIITEVKQDYSDPRSILIDDMAKNIDPWVADDGIGILYTGSPSSAARSLYRSVMGG
jgi:hypothetical protein